MLYAFRKVTALDLLRIILTVYAAACLVYWVRTLYGVVRIRRSIRHLSRETLAAPPVWPSLSVVVPACDEADQLADAAATLLAQTYPDLQVVFVNDRSTDETGAIIDRLAAGDGRVAAVHIETLPDGWLGKVHALQRGLEAARGEYVLFTDADVHYHPAALERAVATMCRDRLDHLAAVPRLRPSSWMTDLLIGQFIRQLFAVFIPPWRIRDPRSKAFFGVGAFNLVRREALDATEGLPWLRMDTGDDMALALMMKRSGGRCDLVWAGDLLQHGGEGRADVEHAHLDDLPERVEGVGEFLGRCASRRASAWSCSMPSAPAANIGSSWVPARPNIVFHPHLHILDRLTQTHGRAVRDVDCPRATGPGRQQQNGQEEPG